MHVFSDLCTTIKFVIVQYQSIGLTQGGTKDGEQLFPDERCAFL